MDISLNQLIQFYLNNTLNLRPLTPQIKNYSYREHRLCDVTSPCVYDSVHVLYVRSNRLNDCLPLIMQHTELKTVESNGQLKAQTNVLRRNCKVHEGERKSTVDHGRICTFVLCYR